jgi:hypothetical protein
MAERCRGGTRLVVLDLSLLEVSVSGGVTVPCTYKSVFKALDLGLEAVSVSAGSTEAISLGLGLRLAARRYVGAVGRVRHTVRAARFFPVALELANIAQVARLLIRRLATTEPVPWSVLETRGAVIYLSRSRLWFH